MAAPSVPSGMAAPRSPFGFERGLDVDPRWLALVDGSGEGDPGLRAALLLGEVYERLLHPPARLARGAHFTPVDVASRLVTFALGDGEVDASFRACDPTCGAGVFLLAVASFLETRGWSRAAAARALYGADIDPLATWVSTQALALWAGATDDHADERILCADVLPRGDVWRVADFDAVIGNPPFQSQLARATTRVGEARRVADTLGGALAPYVDTAALFLVRALDLVRDGGRVALIQPHTTLVARDARAVREAVHARADLTGLWFALDAIFAANVRVCAPVLVRRDTRETTPPLVTRAVDREFASAPPVTPPDSADTWAGLASDLLGGPRVRLQTTRRVGDVATATAGFRDEYYGLVGAVSERRTGDSRPRLITCGLIDLLACNWGVRPAKFAKASYLEPVVDLDVLEGRVHRWVVAQLVPKVLVATQTKVIEVVVDECGDLIPSTPVVAVHAPQSELWMIAAALSAPCVSALALERVAGAALGTNAIKLAARQVLDLPLPVDETAWVAGAALARAAQQTADPAVRAGLLDRLGATMNTAYGCDEPAVLRWWTERRGPA